MTGMRLVKLRATCISGPINIIEIVPSIRIRKDLNILDLRDTFLPDGSDLALQIFHNKGRSKKKMVMRLFKIRWGVIWKGMSPSSLNEKSKSSVPKKPSVNTRPRINGAI